MAKVSSVSIFSPSLRRRLHPQTLLCGRSEAAEADWEETSWQFEKQKQKLVGEEKRGVFRNIDC